MVEPDLVTGDRVLVDGVAHRPGAQPVRPDPGGLDALAGAVPLHLLAVVGVEHLRPREPETATVVAHHRPPAALELLAHRGVDRPVQRAGGGERGGAEGERRLDAVEVEDQRPDGLVGVLVVGEDLLLRRVLGRGVDVALDGLPGRGAFGVRQGLAGQLAHHRVEAVHAVHREVAEQQGAVGAQLLAQLLAVVPDVLDQPVVAAVDGEGQLRLGHTDTPFVRSWVRPPCAVAGVRRGAGRNARPGGRWGGAGRRRPGPGDFPGGGRQLRGDGGALSGWAGHRGASTLSPGDSTDKASASRISFPVAGIDAPGRSPGGCPSGVDCRVHDLTCLVGPGCLGVVSCQALATDNPLSAIDQTGHDGDVRNGGRASPHRRTAPGSPRSAFRRPRPGYRKVVERHISGCAAQAGDFPSSPVPVNSRKSSSE